jgi:hypothetical protein
LVSSSPTFNEDEYWDWSDEPEEPGEDLDSFDPMGPVEFNPSEILEHSTHRGHSQNREHSPNREQRDPQEAESNSGGEEPLVTDDRDDLRGAGEPRGVAEDVVQPVQEAGDRLWSGTYKQAKYSVKL